MFERPEQTGFDVRAPGNRRWKESRVRHAGTEIDHGNRQRTRSRTSPADAAPRVFVLDRDDATRRSIGVALRGSGSRIEGYASTSAFLTRSRVATPSCMILEVAPGDEGLDLQKRLVVERPAMPIIAMAGTANVPTCVKAMKNGALDFFLKPLDKEPLLETVAYAIERSRERIQDATELAAVRERHALLTAREAEVMQRVVSGLLNKQIGYELGISEITVKAHRGKAMHKMRARSLADLVTMALRLGLIHAEPSSLRAPPLPATRSA